MKLKTISAALFIVLFIELVAGGGGRLTAFGPLSLRMVLFAAALIISLVYFLRERNLDKEFRIFLVAFTGSLVIALSMGIINGAEKIYWWEDVKPLSYVFILPFFYYTWRDNDLLPITTGIIRNSAVVMSVLFLLILFLIHSGVIPFLKFYHAVIGTEEFFFRGEITFFYKGFLYLCIGLIFIHVVPGKNRYAWLTLIVAAILLTFTRGFIFALSLTYIAYYFLQGEKLRLAFFVLITTSVLFLAKPVFEKLGKAIDTYLLYEKVSVPRDNVLGNRELSDTGRIDQVKQVVERITPVSFFIGHGFGNGIPVRPVHMEISYLEIFHKQGIAGLLIWSYLLWMVFQAYKRAPPSPVNNAFFFSVLFVYFQSLTNQYINNPIGLSFVLLAWVSLKRNSVKATDVNESSNKISLQKGDEISTSSF